MWYSFGQSICNIRWPRRLQTLTFGPLAWHSIGPCRSSSAGNALRASLQQSFRSGTGWHLLAIKFGSDFNHSLATTSLPTRNPRVEAFLSTGFAVRRYVPLPQSLLRLALGECFSLERHPLFWPRGTQHQAAVCPTADRLLVSGNPAQAGLRWRHFGTVTEISCREEKRTAVLPAWPHSFRLSSCKRKKGWQE